MIDEHVSNVSIYQRRRAGPRRPQPGREMTWHMRILGGGSTLLPPSSILPHPSPQSLPVSQDAPRPHAWTIRSWFPSQPLRAQQHPRVITAVKCTLPWQPSLWQLQRQPPQRGVAAVQKEEQPADGGEETPAFRGDQVEVLLRTDWFH